LQDPGDSGLILKSGDNFTANANEDCLNSTGDSADSPCEATGHSKLNDFFRESSEELNVQNKEVYAKEMSFSSRVKIAPGYTDEHRVFIYFDKEVKHSDASLNIMTAVRLNGF
jgi:hypothetical protein